MFDKWTGRHTDKTLSALGGAGTGAAVSTAAVELAMKIFNVHLTKLTQLIIILASTVAGALVLGAVFYFAAQHCAQVPKVATYVDPNDNDDLGSLCNNVGACFDALSIQKQYCP